MVSRSIPNALFLLTATRVAEQLSLGSRAQVGPLLLNLSAMVETLDCQNRGDRRSPRQRRSIRPETPASRVQRL